MYQKTNQQGPPYSDKQDDDFLLLKDIFGSGIVRAGITKHKQIDISLATYNRVYLNNTMDRSTSVRYKPFQLLVAYKFP